MRWQGLDGLCVLLLPLFSLQLTATTCVSAKTALAPIAGWQPYRLSGGDLSLHRRHGGCLQCLAPTHHRLFPSPFGDTAVQWVRRRMPPIAIAANREVVSWQALDREDGSGALPMASLPRILLAGSRILLASSRTRVARWQVGSRRLIRAAAPPKIA